MFSLRLLTCVLLCLAVSPAPAGELVVVVNARSGVDRLSREEVVNIFMGRYRVLPSGVTAWPIDQPAALPARALFYRKLVDKDLSEINAYWARLVFSGKTSPPRQARRQGEVVDWVASHVGAVGYLDSDLVDARMQIVLPLP